jgi:phosphoribosylformylglycinamidine cyclo-ligase
MQKITYKKAGVDIAQAGVFKKEIVPMLRRSFSVNVLRDIGGFGSFFRLDKKKYHDPVLVSSADGVGTKLKIAVLTGRHDTVGIDAVGMNVNDILCTGAEPLFFLDYIAFSKMKQSALKDVIKGVNNGCIEAGCSLIGGETAQMPGMYKEGDYDIAGFCVGVVERKSIIDGSKIRAGDVIVGLESSGLHSNGFSLVRKALSGKELKANAAVLLKPTRIYVKPILSLLRSTRVNGISHITGGAFYDKIARILPSKVDALIYRNSWKVPKIFELVQDKGGIADREMYHTLNMGIGMVLVVNPRIKDKVISHLARVGMRSWAIGEIIKGKREVRII